MENCCLFYCHPLTHTIYVETFAQQEQKCCISNRIFFYSFRKNNYRGTVYYFNRFHKFSTYETQKKKHSKILISRIHELNSTNTNLRALNTDCQYTTSSSRNTRSHDRRRQMVHDYTRHCGCGGDAARKMFIFNFHQRHLLFG